MAKPPPATPSSDVEGVNRDARIGTPSKDSSKDPGSQIDRARDESKGRPKGTAPSGTGG